jgi:hypothetical protein
MRERRRGNGPNPALLLLIPAAVIIAKGASRRRARWQSAWAGPGEFGAAAAGHRFGHHAGFGPGGGDPSAFRLPPKIEWMLDAWHARAHEQDGATEPAATTTV